MANTKVTSKVIKDSDASVFERLRRRIAGDTQTVNVGFPATGELVEGEEIRLAHLAAVHEFGTLIHHPNGAEIPIPERSFLRAGIRRNKEKYKRLNRANLLKVLKGELTLEQALGQLGEVAKGDVQVEITDGSFAPLKPATIKRKGSSKPLIDSGQLRQGVQWEYGDD